MYLQRIVIINLNDKKSNFSIQFVPFRGLKGRKKGMLVKYEKFLGIVKLYNESMNGTNIKILSKTYDEIKLINKWFDLYPGAEM